MGDYLYSCPFFCMKIRKAIIPAAGLGTRVLPASKAMPKEMLVAKKVKFSILSFLFVLF